MRTRSRGLVAGLVALLSVAAATATATVSTETVAPRRAYALDDGLALTPPMGFNNWNTTGCSSTFNEDMIVAIADIFVSKGLKDARPRTRWSRRPRMQACGFSAAG